MDDVRVRTREEGAPVSPLWTSVQSFLLEAVPFTRNPGSRYPRAYARGTWELKPKLQL
jgi:hypothetical protein